MGALIKRVLKAFFIHMLVLGVALLLIYLLAQGQESLSAEMRARYQGRSAAALLALVDDARGRIMMWCFLAFLASWLTSSLFLVIAERDRPPGIVQARRKLTLWAALLFITITFLIGSAWFNLFEAGVAQMLISRTFLAALLVGGIMTLVAYYLATALAVKRVMRPSVPGAGGMPTFWS